MANLVTDSFDWMPTGASQADRARLYGANGFALHDNGGFAAGDVIAPGRFGYGKAYSQYGSLGGFFGFHSGYVVPVFATPATGFYGTAVYVDSQLPSQCRPLLGFYDGVNNDMQLSYSFEPNGVIKVWKGPPAGGGTPIASSVTGSYQEDEWFHCEAKGTIDASTGGLEVRVNTVPKIQLVSADTKNTATSYFDSVFLGGWTTNFNVSVSSSHPIVFDDMFVNDTTGAENNDWSGNLRAYGMPMIANGYLNNFTIGGSSPASTHWQSVLNSLLDDTKFEYSPNVGDIDAFQPDPVINGPLVRVIQMRAALRQDDATQRVARLGIRIAGNNYFGTVDQYTNQTFTFYKDRFELSPDTGVTATGTEVNGCQALVKVQA